MARPKGSGGRSSYDKYRRFGSRPSYQKRTRRGSFSKGYGGRFYKRVNGAINGNGRKRRKSRFSK